MRSERAESPEWSPWWIDLSSVHNIQWRGSGLQQHEIRLQASSGACSGIADVDIVLGDCASFGPFWWAPNWSNYTLVSLENCSEDCKIRFFHISSHNRVYVQGSAHIQPRFWTISIGVGSSLLGHYPRLVITSRDWVFRHKPTFHWDTNDTGLWYQGLKVGIEATRESELEGEASVMDVEEEEKDEK